ncbi:MAG: PAS domain-containing protein [Rubrivivax sp.]|nr:PAS domain-containing protein [Rubrivivax sp.]
MNVPNERRQEAATEPGLTDELAARAVRMAGIGVWHRVLGADEIVFNEPMFRFLGLAPVAGGRVPWARIHAMQHPEDRGRAQLLNAAVLAGSGPLESELRYVLDDGRVVHLLSRRSVLRDAEGRPLALLGVTLDVTERHAQAQRVDESARRIALMARAAGIGWWAVEGSPPRTTFSDELRRKVGLAPDEPVPPAYTWIERFVHPDDRRPLRALLRGWRAEGGTNLDFSFRLLGADGGVRDIVAHAVFEPRGTPTERFGMLVDITERRAAERALREERERTALATHAAGMGIWELDVESGGSSWTEAMWRLRGLVPRHPTLSAEERIALVHPEDRERVRGAMRMTTARNEALDIEFRVVWPDGQVRWIASRSVPLPPDGSGRKRRIGVNWDVTDRRQAEQARRDAEVALRESQAKSRFLARMSHELRTPLNAVLGFAQILQAEPPEGSAADTARRQSIAHIQRAGEHLLTLINEVLDLARIEAGEMELARAPVALADLVAQTLPLVAPQAQAAGIRLSTGALDAVVLGDETRLRQVLLNLLSNGIKYNRAGGEVHVEAAVHGPFVQLLVRDSGRGIAPARLPDLFQPFNRLGAERETIEGTGIGLAIVKSLVEHMGGHVQVKSTLGEGTMFDVALPAAPAPPDSAADPASPAAPAAGDAAPAAGEADAGAAATAASAATRRVLYIEDNEVNALIVREMLATVPGYRLTIAADGMSGLAAALADPPELVLLDMQLPDIDGFEVLRRLRQQPATAALPVVALSANVMAEQIRRGLAAGLADYWTKPLDMTLFLQNMARLLPPRPA